VLNGAFYPLQYDVLNDFAPTGEEALSRNGCAIRWGAMVTLSRPTLNRASSRLLTLLTLKSGATTSLAIHFPRERMTLSTRVRCYRFSLADQPDCAGL
jgi:hypothetical protein